MTEKSSETEAKPVPDRSRRILVMGLPGAGKTTLASVLARRLAAVHFNADEVRSNINRDLGFSHEDRIEQARRMGWLCDRVVETGHCCIADFVCPTPATREAFGAAFIVWVDRIAAGRFPDTNRIFVPPEQWDVRVTAEGAPEWWAEQIVARLRPVFDPAKPTALFVGRYQPFHDGHRALVLEGLRRVGQACIAVRTVPDGDLRNPYKFEEVRARIETALADQAGRFVVVPLPNITHVFYGREVGYAVERIDLDSAVHAISATKLRALLGHGAASPSPAGGRGPG